ncbi:MAG TPA: hypothetical protein VGK67_23210 [Myxococcales bacterium]|jgi:hypothetical protein
MGKARAWLVVGSACVALSACGGDGGGGGGGNDAGTGTPKTVDELCAAVTDAIANRASVCFGGPQAAWRTLVAGEGATALCTQWSKGVAAGRISFDASESKACLDSLPSVACSDLIGGPQPAACRGALAGQVSIGSACYADSECSGEGVICDLIATCPGRCAARIGAGGSCAASGAVCAFGATCAAGVCVADANTGQACGQDLPACKYGLVCLAQTSPATTGTCEPESPNGACVTSSTCLPTFACAGPDGSSQCAPAKAEGQACTEGHFECAVLTSCVAGKCQAFPSLGGACDPTGARGEGSDCLQGTCSGGRCVALLGKGQACQLDSACASGVCASGACTAACQAP